MYKKHKIQQKYTLAYYKSTHSGVIYHGMYATLNRCVLTVCLKVSIDLHDRISLGRAFQILGAY